MAEHKKDQVNPDLSAADAADDVSHAGDDAIDAVDEVSRVVDEMSKVTGMMDGLLSDDSPVPSSTTTDANAGNTASDNIEELLKDTSLVADPTAANNNDAESIDDLPELLGDLDAEIAEAEASIGELLDTLESVGDAGESTQTSEASERTSTTDPETSVDPDLVPASESESLVAEAAEAQESLSTSDAAAESVLDGFNETGNLDDAQADGVDEGLESVESSDVQNDDGVSETQPDLAELDGADDPEQQESFKESEDAQDLVEAEPVETAADMGADPIDEASALENTEEFDDSFDDVSEDALAEVEAELVRAPESAGITEPECAVCPLSST